MPSDRFHTIPVDKREAFRAAVSKLLEEADNAPRHRRLLVSLRAFFSNHSNPRIDRQYILAFAGIDALEPTLSCCDSLGVDKQRVKAIHALIFN